MPVAIFSKSEESRLHHIFFGGAVKNIYQSLARRDYVCAFDYQFEQLRPVLMNAYPKWANRDHPVINTSAFYVIYSTANRLISSSLTGCIKSSFTCGHLIWVHSGSTHGASKSKRPKQLLDKNVRIFSSTPGKNAAQR